MKKLLGILVLGLLWCNILIAEEYPNSWKLDIHCKQGSTEDNPDSTFTPLPKNITPLGMELDPDTGVDLSSSDKK